jgi:hypothetical protein
VARAAAPFFRIGVLRGFLEDLGLERLLAEQPVQFADLLLKRTVVGGGHHRLPGRRRGEGAVGREAAPGEELVRVHAVAPGHEADRGARFQALPTIRIFSAAVQRRRLCTEVTTSTFSGVSVIRTVILLTLTGVGDRARSVRGQLQ